MKQEQPSEHGESLFTQDGVQSAGRLTNFHCPACPETELSVGFLHEFQVCFCQTCEGFIIPQDSFARLVPVLRNQYTGSEDRPTPIAPKQLREKRNCPACHQAFETHPYYGPGNVVIDSCEHCELLWLDKSELLTIQRAPGPRPRARW